MGKRLERRGEIEERASGDEDLVGLMEAHPSTGLQCVGGPLTSLL